MARMPGTVWQGEQSPRRPMERYDIVCVHTIVGYAPAHAAHFSVKADGTIIQSRDTAYQSGANLDGNHRVIAIENEDHGPRFGGTPQLPAWVALTPEQVEANGRILAWAHETHGVPLQLCPDSRPVSRGLAYHRQGIDGDFDSYRFPGRVPGGEIWTTSPGKVCPTDARIAQLPDILATARGLQEDDMAQYDEQLDRIEKNTEKAVEISQQLRKRGLAQTTRLRKRLDKIAAAGRSTTQELTEIRDDLADLERALSDES